MHVYLFFIMMTFNLTLHLANNKKIFLCVS